MDLRPFVERSSKKLKFRKTGSDLSPRSPLSSLGTSPVFTRSESPTQGEPIKRVRKSAGRMDCGLFGVSFGIRSLKANKDHFYLECAFYLKYVPFVFSTTADLLSCE